MRILVIEDDTTVVSFVVKGLREAGFSVEHSSNGTDGLFLASQNEFDLIVLDLMLPDINGFEIIRRLREKGITTFIIVLSAKGSVEDRVKGLELGADDYLGKPFSFTELLARVQAGLRRLSQQKEPTVLSIADLEIDLHKRTVNRGDKKIELQPKEFALLEYLMRNAGRVVSKTMIMEHVWDYNFDPQTNVVEARICRLRNKIDKEFSAKLIHTIKGAGYVLKAGE